MLPFTRKLFYVYTSFLIDKEGERLVGSRFWVTRCRGNEKASSVWDESLEDYPHGHGRKD